MCRTVRGAGLYDQRTSCVSNVQGGALPAVDERVGDATDHDFLAPVQRD